MERSSASSDLLGLCSEAVRLEGNARKDDVRDGEPVVAETQQEIARYIEEARKGDDLLSVHLRLTLLP